MEVGKIDENGHTQGELDGGEAFRMALVTALYCLKKYGEQNIPMDEFEEIEIAFDEEKLTMTGGWVRATNSITMKAVEKE